MNLWVYCGTIIKKKIKIVTRISEKETELAQNPYGTKKLHLLSKVQLPLGTWVGIMLIMMEHVL